MFSVIAKRIVASYLVSSPHHHRLVPVTPLFQHLTTQSQKPTEEILFMAQYLISSFGFSPDRALRWSTDGRFTPIKSSDRPESVVRFLKETGLSDDQIKAVVSFYPLLLASNVEKTLKPKVHELIDAGFPGELLVQFIRYNPKILCSKQTLSRLLFWRDFVENSDKGLLKIIPKNTLLFTLDIDKHIGPRINLLKEYGFSNRDIVVSLADGSRCMTQSMNSLRERLELVEELGLSRGSRLFCKALKVVGSLSKETMKRKMEFFKKTCGWSEEEISSAFRKFPSIYAFSTEKVKLAMDFLIKKAGIEPKNIALRPKLLGYSLEKRLVPRYRVLSILAAKGLNKTCSLASACVYSEEIFLRKYVEPYKKDVPEARNLLRFIPLLLAIIYPFD